MGPLFLRLTEKGSLFQLLCLKCAQQFFTELNDSKKPISVLKETNEEATYDRVYTAAGS
jgi:hypothetical protein